MNTLNPNRHILFFVWWLAVFCFFALVHTPKDWFMNLFLNSWGRFIADYYSFNTPQLILSSIINPLRGIVFLFSFATMIFFVIRGVNWSNPFKNLQTFRPSRELAVSLLVFIVLCILVSPTGLHGLAMEYSNTSLVMFDRVNTNYSSRLLLPALAYILFFRGDLFYFLFSILCAYVLVFVLRLWFIQNNIRVSFLGFISLCTLGFVNFQLHHPGYPDSLVFIFILLAFSFHLDLYAKLSLFVLALISHEASLIIWSAIAFSLFSSKKEYLYYALVSILYLGFLLMGAGGIENVITLRQVGGISNLDWVLQNPIGELQGIFFAFRAYWLLVIAALWIVWSKRDYKRLWQLLIVLMASLFMTFLGVDTSRLVGWGFMLVLFSWQVVDEQVDPRWQTFISIVLILNFIIPPYFVQLVQSPYIPRGLYAILMNLVR